MAVSSPYICFNCRISPRYGLTQLQFRRRFSVTLRTSQILRPATAPKPTPDIKHIRQNADLYAQNCVDRNYAGHAEYPLRIQALYDEAKQLDHDLKTPRSRIKQLEKTSRSCLSRLGRTLPKGRRMIRLESSQNSNQRHSS
jgi:hypothetical protein